MTLFDDDLGGQTLNDELMLLVGRYGFDPVEHALGLIKRSMGGPIAPSPARHTDPETSQRGVRSGDVRRFSARSLSGKLLQHWALNGPCTDREATEALMGADAYHRSYDGARRRCSDLRKAGYLADTGTERDNQIVWDVTPFGRKAAANLAEWGWAR